MYIIVIHIHIWLWSHSPRLCGKCVLGVPKNINKYYGVWIVKRLEYVIFQIYNFGTLGRYLFIEYIYIYMRKSTVCVFENLISHIPIIKVGRNLFLHVCLNGNPLIIYYLNSRIQLLILNNELWIIEWSQCYTMQLKR